MFLDEDMTLRQLADVYLERYVDVERASTMQAFTYALNTICRTVIPCATKYLNTQRPAQKSAEVG